MNQTTYKELLLKRAKELNVPLCYVTPILDDEAFLVQSGCHHSRGHHYGEGGLIRHTWEVVELCLQTANLYMHQNIDIIELFVSALWHDYGKVWDYVKDEITGEFSPDKITEHRRRIHHISRSAIEWQICARKNSPVPFAFIDRVTHNILSHHGQREFGSPVAPRSREAWILHLCDSLSARVDDCDRLDLVKINK